MKETIFQLSVCNELSKLKHSILTGELVNFPEQNKTLEVDVVVDKCVILETWNRNVRSVGNNASKGLKTIRCENDEVKTRYLQSLGYNTLWIDECVWSTQKSREQLIQALDIAVKLTRFQGTPLGEL